jgi:hypothetical protein
MDVIYPLVGTSEEIKYSIRSLVKHTSFDKIFIIGDKPEFFEYTDKLVHIPFVQTQLKEVNIWEKVLCAAKDPRVSEEFFFMNDDYFFLEDFKMEEFPHYHKGNLKDLAYINYPIQSQTGYKKSVVTTYKLLKKLKLSTWHFDIHTPNRYEKSKFISAYEFFKPYIYQAGHMIISTCYGNYNQLEPTYRQDIKITPNQVTEFIKGEKDLMFSTHDAAFNKELIEYLATIYPKTEFER